MDRKRDALFRLLSLSSRVSGMTPGQRKTRLYLGVRRHRTGGVRGRLPGWGVAYSRSKKEEREVRGGLRSNALEHQGRKKKQIVFKSQGGK